MADTEQTRANTLLFATGFPPLPWPDGDIDKSDRAALVGALSGLTSGGVIYNHASRTNNLLIEQFKSDTIVSI